ncbi:AAA family ATPase [Oceanobacillus sp. Castelsardo]|uniref:ATP-binding protein n=1 Tax=Oceanobacillus sp. Castelsardo TaxID=1851204 RepID=UPI0008394C28|nr:AAA family ATPase [Oceanobacillus sp. Castelsardo]
MKFTKAYIHGFGKWVNFDISFSDGICIYGENESGKSTIYHFILFMLFGLPPKQREFYRPKSGGQIGGRLTVLDEKVGQFTIERLDSLRNGAAICYTSDGMEHDEDWLKERLMGTTLETYQSIFSFSAMDLNKITNMKEADLGEVLLGIGLTGSTEIHTLEKKLDNKLAELFKPYGKKPMINQQLDTLDKQFALLQEYKKNEATYREKIINESHLEDRLCRLQEEFQDEKKNLLNVEKKIQALPLLGEYIRYHSNLKKYGHNLEFPEHGETRLEDIKSNLLPLQSEMAVLKGNVEKYQEKLEQLQNKLSNQELYEEAQTLIKLKHEFYDNKKELERAENHIDSKKMEMELELNRLNVGLTFEQLYRMNFPFHIEKTWIQIKNDEVSVTLEKERIQAEVQQLKQERNYLYNQLEELEEQILPDEKVFELNEKINGFHKHNVVRSLQNEAAQKQQNWRENRVKKEKSMNFYLISSLVIAVIFSIIGLVTDIRFLLDISFLLLLFGVGQWMWGRKGLKEMEVVIQSEYQTDAFNVISKEEVQDAEIQISKHHKCVTDMENIKEQLKSNDIKRLNYRDKMNVVEDRYEKIQQQIKEQYEIYPFLKHVDTSYWPELFHAMKQLVSQFKEYTEVLEDKEKLQDKITLVKSTVNEFVQEQNWEIGDLIEQQLGAIESFIMKQHEISQQIEQYSQLLKENKKEQDELLLRIKTYEREKWILFELAQVESEELFYRKSDQVKERKLNEEALDNTCIQLERLFPNGQWKPLVDNIQSESELEWIRNATENNIEELHWKISESQKELVTVQTQLETMESSEEYSNNLHQLEMEQEQLNKLAREWAIIKTAKELLIETKRIYKEKHLHQVMEATSNFFNRLTGNKYERVFAPINHRSFQVEANNGIRYEVNELSKGTIDQLYVSLRLAIGKTMSESNHLPFIMDDAFLHFDSLRIKQVINILEDMSKFHQIILFTCKDEIALNMSEVETVFLMGEKV